MVAHTAATPPSDRPWGRVPIIDCGEPLQALPPQLLRLEPHPYQQLGAPYGSAGGPFQLRQGVVGRLLEAEAALQRQAPQLRLAIFDGWRPLAVQAFMVRQAFADTCRERGLDPQAQGQAQRAVAEEVGRFWAPPNPDPAAPPPHSTGGAVDLTLAVRGSGAPVAMGSAIDTIGAVSEPDHWQARAQACGEAPQRDLWLSWHRNRCLLRAAMEAAGFGQHPHEWWHFSWGDQLWAWRSGAELACYGRVDGSP